VAKPTKECYWCKKQRPYDETGSFEMEPDTDKEIAWICNHCVADFLGWERDDETYNAFAQRYNLEHPKDCLLPFMRGDKEIALEVING